MDDTLFLAQLIKDGELGGSNKDVVAINYDFSPIFDAWLDPQNDDTYVLRYLNEDQEEDILYSELISLLQSSSDLEKLAKYKIICYTDSNVTPGSNITLECFHRYVNSRTDEVSLSCHIHYMNPGYEYMGVVDGIMSFNTEPQESGPDVINLYLDTTYGVFNLKYELEPK